MLNWLIMSVIQIAAIAASNNRYVVALNSTLIERQKSILRKDVSELGNGAGRQGRALAVRQPLP